MKLNLRKKIILFLLLINFIIALTLGIALYKTAGGLYYKAFLESKLTLARSIAMSIDGDKHKNMTSLKAASDPEYKRYLKYLNEIKTHEDYMSYLFTINYDRDNDRLMYIIDADILTTDTIWITTEFFGFALSINKSENISIKYNEDIYTGNFEVKFGNLKYKVKISDDGVVTIDGTPLVKIIAKDALDVDTGAGLLNRNNREVLTHKKIGSKNVEVYYSFTAKGESQSLSGELYVESKDVTDRCRHIINSQKSIIITRDMQTSIYGQNTSTVYGIIKDSSGIANGLVVIELFQREVAAFQQSITIIAAAASAMTFIITIFITFFLSEYIISPIRRLSQGAVEVSGGNLDTVVKINRKDEFGLLADNFNAMVSCLKNAYIDLKSANEELKKTDQMKDEFLANTSHELKTPLTGIIGIAESLMDGAVGPVNSLQWNNLQMIVLSGRRLSHLVNDILDFSKMKNNTVTLGRRPVDVRQITEIIITLLIPLVGSKSIKLINMISHDTPYVYADENRLQQIMYNLMGNAVKFTESGKVTVSAAVKQSTVIISVEDTGIGIPENNFEKIFRHFEQGDSSDARLYGGTGLGLAITKKLVELHGGKITVKSKVGSGSIFSFELPAASDAVLDSEPVAPRSYFDESYKPASAAADLIHFDTSLVSPRKEINKNSTILIVDDEPVNLQVLVNQLRLEGYELITAENGMQAINIILEKKVPDLVLLDVMMPKMTGYHVCSLIRERFSLYDLPVLLLTAKNQIQDIVAGFESGANDYLSKPFDKRELLARVDMLITLKNAVISRSRYEGLQKELEIARRIQFSILPEKLPVVNGLDIQSCYIPMDLVGGDFYDFHAIDSRHLGAIVADVSGHGIPSSLISSMVKIAFYMQSGNAGSPEVLLGNIHNTLIGKCETHFITAAYIYIDLDRMTLTHSSAGHNPLLVLKKAEGRVISVETKGRIIGLIPSGNFAKTEISIEKGDRLILYTDCVIETRNSSGELFGFDRFYDFVSSSASMSAADFTASIPERLKEWAGNDGDFEDDLTVVIIDVL